MKIKQMIKDLDSLRDKLSTEYDELISHMQPYDASAFSAELQSEFSYYSLVHFDEEEFKKTVMRLYDVDLSDEATKRLTIDTIYYYSQALITISALRDYIKANDIVMESDDEFRT